eukprot:g11701.t1
MQSPRNVSPRSPRRGLFDSPMASPRAMRRCMSERGLTKQEDKPSNLFNRDEPFWTSPRTPRSWKDGGPSGATVLPKPTSPKPQAHLVGSAARGRSAEALPLKPRELSPRDTLQDWTKEGVPLPEPPLGFWAPALALLHTCLEDRQERPNVPRSKSPNFDVSEDWMAWSRPPEPSSPRHDGGMMPSSNFKSPLRRMHSGKITRNSENWLRMDGQDVHRFSTRARRFYSHPRQTCHSGTAGCHWWNGPWHFHSLGCRVRWVDVGRLGGLVEAAVPGGPMVPLRKMWKLH